MTPNPNIGISENNRQAVVTELSKVLADEFILYVKTRNAHWNVEGSDFYEKHKFFETQFQQLDEIIDSIAERIRSLGHHPPASLQEFIQLSQLKENINTDYSSKIYISQLLNDHESIIVGLRANISRFAEDFKDHGSSDFITGLTETHEKMAWFLRSHIQ